MWVLVALEGHRENLQRYDGTEACCSANIFESASIMSVAAWRGKCQRGNFTGQKWLAFMITILPPRGSCSVEVLSLESRCVHAKGFLPSWWQPGATEKVSRPASGRRLAGRHRREGVAARQPTGCSRCKSRVLGRTADARGWI
jgi:hypothetical protein